MKRLPLVCSVLAVVGLSASLAYWGLQFYKPAQRPLAPSIAVSVTAPLADMAGAVFGGQSTAAVASNYVLKGVIAATRAAEGVAIIAVDGKTNDYKVGAEVAPGVVVKEVQPRFIVLSEGGVLKRIELPADSKSAAAGVILPTAVSPPPTLVNPITPMTPPPIAPPPIGGVQPTPSMMMPPPASGASSNPTNSR